MNAKPDHLPVHAEAETDMFMPFAEGSPVFAKDAYKTGHLYQYPPNTQFVYSNLTARGSNNFAYQGFNGKIVTAGFRSFVAEQLLHFWDEYFFTQDIELIVDQYQAMINSALGNGAVHTQHLRDLHALGYLPLRVKALPEGELVNLRVPLMTIINTDPKFSWLTNFIETLWSNETWKPITVATIAYEYRRLFTKWAKATGAPLDFVPFQGHDFSARGMAGHNDSRRASVGHLFSFVGSDSLEAGDYAVQYYHADWTRETILMAPPATEHAVMCMRYAVYGELETYRQLITEVYPTGMVAIVSDTINLWTVLTEVAQTLKPEIMAREGGTTGPGKVVFRPDSGEPIKILTGDNEWPILNFEGGFILLETPEPDANGVDEAAVHTKQQVADFCFEHYFAGTKHLFNEPQTRYVIVGDVETSENHYRAVTFPPGHYTADGLYQSEGSDSWGAIEAEVVPFEPTPAQKGAFQILWEGFGGTVNDRGYKTLDSHVGLVYGDSITLERAEAILAKLAELGFASNNAVLGIGSFTYQYMTRDTFGLAIKATWAQIDGTGYDLQKKPATDVGVKHSAKGLMRVEKEGNDYVLYEEQTRDEEIGGELQLIFEDGDLYNTQSLSEIREKLWPVIQ